MRLYFCNYFLTLVVFIGLSIYLPSSVFAEKSTLSHPIIDTKNDTKRKKSKVSEKSAPFLNQSHSTGKSENVNQESLSMPKSPEANNESDPANARILILPTRNLVEHSNTFSLSLRLGDYLPQKATGTLIGANWTRNQYNSNLTAQSFGFSFYSNSDYGPHWDFQWNQNPGIGSERVYKIGVGGLFDPNETMGSWLRMERYHLRAIVGWEDVLKMHRRLRFDIGLYYSPYGISYGMNLGWALADEQLNFLF